MARRCLNFGTARSRPDDDGRAAGVQAQAAGGDSGGGGSSGGNGGCGIGGSGGGNDDSDPAGGGARGDFAALETHTPSVVSRRGDIGGRRQAAVDVAQEHSVAEAAAASDPWA